MEARSSPNCHNQAIDRSSLLSIQGDMASPWSMEKKALRTRAPNSIHIFPSPQRLKKIGHWEMEMLGGWSHSRPWANFPGLYIFGRDVNIPPSLQIHMARGQRHGEGAAKMPFSMIETTELKILWVNAQVTKHLAWCGQDWQEAMTTSKAFSVPSGFSREVLVLSMATDIHCI